jgi:peptidoglycan hydrolase CwlO-like protein
LSQSEPHDEFLELCAVSTSGELTEEEQKRLQEHLAVCSSCREALRQYQSVVDQAIPSIAAIEESENEEPQRVEHDPSWSQDRAEKALFDRLAREQKRSPNRADNANSPSDFPHRIFPTPSESTWRHVWMLYAAGILLFVALSFFAYRIGMRRGTDIAQAVPPQPSTPLPVQPSLEEQLSDAGHEHEVARAEIVHRDRMIAELRRQLERQSAEINEMKASQARLEKDLQAGDASRQDLIQQRTELAEKLDTAQTNSQSLQEKMGTLTQQSADDANRLKASEAKVNDLTHQLQQRETDLEQQDELLAHDRDIRELMGARDLYIAEVYDVAGTGETKKPYGRVFYTRGKSLIFYAYDLDQQTELKRASAFQAWGRRGPDRQQSVNLGIFYEDNASRKRWILECDDPKTLAQIDAVFVTVEPNGGSHKPSSKPLLFAYLKVNPNHP